MKRTQLHALRRGLFLALPAVILGIALYVPNALAANGATVFGVVLMFTPILVFILDYESADG